MEENNKIIPKIKISDNIEKITNPHFKKIIRLYDDNNKIISDLLCVHNEKLPKTPLIHTHPSKPWVKKEVTNFHAVDIRVKMIENGKVIYKLPSINETRDRVQNQLATLWPEALRLENPQIYVLNLSDKLTNIKNDLLNFNKK